VGGGEGEGEWGSGVKVEEDGDDGQDVGRGSRLSTIEALCLMQLMLCELPSPYHSSRAALVLASCVLRATSCRRTQQLAATCVRKFAASGPNTPGVPPLTKAINYHVKINGFNGLYNGTPADFGQHTSTTTFLEDLTNRML
jgi:hypothetical protein